VHRRRTPGGSGSDDRMAHGEPGTERGGVGCIRLGSADDQGAMGRLEVDRGLLGSLAEGICRPAANQRQSMRISKNELVE
jgi:hypothetical protein